MNVNDYVRILRRRWAVLAVCVLLSLAGAVVVTLRTVPQYASSITLFVSSSDYSTDVSSAYQASLLSEQRVKSYANLLSSERLASQLAESLKDGLSAADLQRRISAGVIPDSVLLRATVTDTSAERSKEIADMLGTQFARLVSDLERRADNKPSPIRITVVDHAVASHAPVSPRPLYNVLLGLSAGLMVGAALALLRDSLDTTVKTVDTLREMTGSSPLGTIAFDSAAPKRPLIVQERAGSPRAEPYRCLRTNLNFVDVDKPPRVILITSCVMGEGKSTTACNLAISLAEAGTRVLLIEADLRRPHTSDYLGIERAAGLTSVVVGDAALDEVLQPWGHSGNLIVLPSGPIPPNPSELLGSRRMAEILEQCTALADIVLIDSPPLLPVTDAAILGHISDGALLVVRWGTTRKEHVSKALEQLDAVNARLLGTVLSMVKVRGGSSAYGTYRYSPYFSSSAPQVVAEPTPLPPPVPYTLRPRAATREEEKALPGN